MKNILLIFMVSILFIVPGCWDRTELNSLSIVQGAAVDKDQNGLFMVTVQSPNPSPSQGGMGSEDGDVGGGGFFISSARGHSVFDAARHLTLQLHRRNYWPHTQIVAIGDALTHDSILSVVDFFTRDTKRRLSTYFIVTEGMSKNLLVNQPEIAALSAIEITEIIGLTSANGYGVDLDLRAFLRESEGFSGSSLLNKFKSIPKESVEDDDSEETPQTSALDGTGVFNNYKLLGYLTPLETRNVNWMRDNVGNWVLTTNFTGGHQSEITTELLSSKTSLSPEIGSDGDLTLKAKITVTGKIAEYRGESPLETTSIEEFENKFAQDIKNQIEETFEKIQEDFQVDVFNIGSAFARKYPVMLDLEPEEWNELFSSILTLELDVEFKMIYSGTRVNRAR